MKKYYINDCETEEDNFWDVLSSAIENEVEWNIDDIIDEQNEEIKIGCCSFSPSEVLKNCDHIAYNCYMDDIKNFFYDDDKYDLSHGREVERDCTTFRIEEEDEEEE